MSNDIVCPKPTLITPEQARELRNREIEKEREKERREKAQIEAMVPVVDKIVSEYIATICHQVDKVSFFFSFTVPDAHQGNDLYKIYINDSHNNLEWKAINKEPIRTYFGKDAHVFIQYYLDNSEFAKSFKAKAVSLSGTTSTAIEFSW